MADNFKNKARGREIFGWCMYDFANSSFATTILAAILPVYFVMVVPEGGVMIRFLGWEFKTSAASLWGYTMAASMLFVALSSPILGAIADFSGIKKKFLFVYCYLGCIFSSFLYFVEVGNYWLAIVLFIFANIGFAGGNVFYNAFLPEIASETDMNWISGKGFAYGYLGGGLLLVVNLVMIERYYWFGIPNKILGTRLSLLSVGIWWAVFAIPFFLFVMEKAKKQSLPQGNNYFTIAFSKLKHTIAKIKDYRELALFLIAFLIYNDGIQTVIFMSAVFGKTELSMSQGSLIGCFLLIQLVAILGALFFGYLGDKISAKKTLLFTLGIWCGIIIWAFYMKSSIEFWVLGIVVGIVLGGSQSISRSLYGLFIPAQNSAEFFGFFAISNKFSSILGPLVFALIMDWTKNIRYSILSIIIFFLIGITILFFVNEKKGIIEGKNPVTP